MTPRPLPDRTEPDPVPWDLAKAIPVEDGQVSLLGVEDDQGTMPVVGLYLKVADSPAAFQFLMTPAHWEAAIEDYLNMVERNPEWNG